MNNYFWLVVLPNLECFFEILSVGGLVVTIIGAFSICAQRLDYCNDEQEKECKKLSIKLTKVLTASILLFFLTCFIPNKKDIFQLRAISIVQELKGINEIPQKLIDRLNDLLDTQDKK